MLLLEYWKKCNKCGETKPFKNYCRNNGNKCKKDNCQAHCRECSHKEFNKYRLNHKEQISKRYKNYCNDNKKKINLIHKNYRLINKDKCNEWNRKSWKNDKYRHERRRKYHINVLTKRPDYKLKKLLRARIKNAVKIYETIKSNKTMILIGCDANFLKQHLQQTAINNGYFNFDINNFSGKEFNIDHIIPCSKFNLKCSYHQKLCFNWTNLQILSAKENQVKKDKILVKGF